MGTIIVSILLVIWVCLVLRTIYKNKKKGIGVMIYVMLISIKCIVKRCVRKDTLSVLLF